MSEVHRYYDCGCCPEEDEFCKDAEKYVQMERTALLQREGLEKAATYSEGFARGWMNCHIITQDQQYTYQDVAYPSEPPDDGYDEDPAVVGYP